MIKVKDEKKYFDDNVLGLKEVMNFAATNKVKKIYIYFFFLNL